MLVWSCHRNSASEMFILVLEHPTMTGDHSAHERTGEAEGTADRSEAGQAGPQRSDRLAKPPPIKPSNDHNSGGANGPQCGTPGQPFPTDQQWAVRRTAGILFG